MDGVGGTKVSREAWSESSFCHLSYPKKPDLSVQTPAKEDPRILGVPK